MKKYIKGYKTRRTVVQKQCEECDKKIEVLQSEIKRGAGKFCSRVCYYVNQKKTRPSAEKSWAWKGDNVGREALHNWVQKHLGKPKRCEHCNTTKAKKFEWANKSQKYKRDLTDWIRLCTKCHWKYDYKVRYPKWAKAVKKLGWKLKK